MFCNAPSIQAIAQEQHAYRGKGQRSEIKKAISGRLESARRAAITSEFLLKWRGGASCFTPKVAAWRAAQIRERGNGNDWCNCLALSSALGSSMLGSFGFVRLRWR
jgi:hypothetical protein